MPPDASGSPWFYLLAIALLALGLGGLWFGWRFWALASASKTWPNVVGKVLHSYVQEVQSTDQQDQTVTMYHARVEYEYLVDGQRLEGKRIQFGGPAGSGIRSKAEAIAARYPAGATVEVFYDPAKPSVCVLDRTISRFGIALMMGMGLFFIIVGAAVLVLARAI